MERYLKSVTKECHEKILDQLNNSICIIKEKDGNKDLGLFCNIKYKNENIYVLLKNNHMNNDDYLDKITVSINNKDKILEIEDIIYKSEDYNISMIKIKERDDSIKYLEIEEDLFEKESEMYYNNESIYVIQYDNIKDLSISYGILKEINNNEIKYICNTNSKHQFNPIFNLTNNRLIGMHKNKGKYFNNGISFKTIIKDYRIKSKYNSFKSYKDNLNEKIMILIDIKKEDINKEIYFLDNGYRTPEFFEHYEHNNLKELNNIIQNYI